MPGYCGRPCTALARRAFCANDSEQRTDHQPAFRSTRGLRSHSNRFGILAHTYL
jgi:hypothetical protein